MKFNIAILGLVLIAFTSASAANKTWTGSVNTEWHEHGNWLPSGVPAHNDTITIENASVNASPPVTIAGTLNWTNGGTFFGALNIASGGVLNLGGEGTKHFLGAVTNAGTIRWSGPHDLYVYQANGGVMVNLAGALFDAQNDQGILCVSGCSTEGFHNAGLFRKSAGTGTSTVGISFANTGTVQAHSGTISFQGPFADAPFATLAISIGGAGTGTDYGHIHFADPLALNGSFTASTRNGFHPNPGDTFDVLSYPSFTGELDCFSGVNLGGGIWLAPTITQKHMGLTAVAYGTNGVPALFAARWPSGVRLFRTPGFPDWELVTTTNLFAPAWTPVPLAGCDQVTLPPTAPAQFFRLRKNN